MEIFTHIPLFGSLANALMIVAGGLLGLIIKKRLPMRLLEMPVMGLEIYVILLGISYALKSRHPLIMVASIALGSLIGETIDLDGKLKLLGDAVERKLGDCGSGFSKGFVSTTLIFCTGSMAVMGGLEEGFGHFPTTLLTKGMIDGITNIAFSATLGFGVIFSSIPVFLYQGMFTIAAKWLAPLMTETAITEMTSVGGIMLMAVGINMMELKKLRPMNMLPGFAAAVILVRLCELF